MGLEKEKLESSIIMDEDEFNRSIEPILSQKVKVYSSAPDRDPYDINPQLKVNFAELLFKSENNATSCDTNYLNAPLNVTPFSFPCNTLRSEYLEVAACSDPRACQR